MQPASHYIKKLLFVEKKTLIVHADDFGFSPGISRGILYAIKRGIVSSTSVMVIGRYVQDTKRLIEENPMVDWGLHVVFQEQQKRTNADLLRETERQLQFFLNHFCVAPSHIDFHKGFQFNSKIYFHIRMLAKRYNLAFRYDNMHVINSSFYGLKRKQVTLDDITVGALIKIFDSLLPGVTELICHPGWTSNHLRDPYRTQRVIEIQTLTDPTVKQAVSQRNIQIINFSEYKKLCKRSITTHEINL